MTNKEFEIDARACMTFAEMRELLIKISVALDKGADYCDNAVISRDITELQEEVGEINALQDRVEELEVEVRTLKAK